jgi:soluble lytic murein transglycosylase
MQLMPDTAKRTAKKIGQPYDRGKLTSDPGYNARLGAAYFAEQLATFDKVPELALAAYNAGPQRVTRWIGANGDPRTGSIDMIDWVELIPFRETRNYVQRVMEAYNVYRIRLAARPDPLPPGN